jgi:multiple antibiotic resistance protein
MPDSLTILRSAALAIAALLPIVNPAGSAPIFLSMTHGATSATRVALARRIAINSLLLLLAAMFIGSYVLNLFGLSIAVVKIAGGLLVIANGWHLIRSDEAPDSNLVKAPEWSPAEIQRQAFYPLTFPLTVGPGSVSVAITIGAGTSEGGMQFIAVAGTLLGILVVSGTIYVSFRYAARLLAMLGDTGSVVLLRLSAFILLAVGVQIFTDGLAERFKLFN